MSWYAPRSRSRSTRMDGSAGRPARSLFGIGRWCHNRCAVRHASLAYAPAMDYRRMPIEAESPEQFGYDRIRFNLAESSVADTPLRDLDVSLDELVLLYGDHLGRPGLRAAIAAGAVGIGPDDVLVTPGAAAALFIISTTLL